MVIGPANSGKSTMVKGLLNLAIGSGMGWSPGVVGLDSGTVGAATCGGLRQDTDKDLSATPVKSLGTRLRHALNTSSGRPNTSPKPSFRVYSHDSSGHDSRIGRPDSQLVCRQFRNESKWNGQNMLSAMEERSAKYRRSMARQVCLG